MLLYLLVSNITNIIWLGLCQNIVETFLRIFYFWAVYCYEIDKILEA